MMISNPILPPATIGILGSGQLGRMLALEARQMGYRVHVLSPDQDSPTGQIADKEYTADYADLAAIETFAKGVDVVTYEFENVPAETAVVCQKHAPLRPGPQALHVAQNRLREKQFFQANGLPTVPFAEVNSPESLAAAIAEIGVPSVLKTASSGYDGKGQRIIQEEGQAQAAWAELGNRPSILEGFIHFEKEVSVVGARGIDGSFAHFGLLENDHANHILDVTMGGVDNPTEVLLENTAVKMTQTVLEALDVVGVLCVEFFVTREGKLLLNEIAPRPHNSGHLTIEACHTSQFGQQLRAICGLLLGDSSFHKPSAMANILGDVWFKNGGKIEPTWTAVLENPAVHLHLYGKKEARKGRKMGHLTALADSGSAAREIVVKARDRLGE